MYEEEIKDLQKRFVENGIRICEKYKDKTKNSLDCSKEEQEELKNNDAWYLTERNKLDEKYGRENI